MELVKTIVAICLSPLIISLLVQFIGWVQIRRKRNRSGHFFLAMGTLILLVGAVGGLSAGARQRREYTHPPLEPSQASFETSPVVVVLGTGFNPDTQLPANSRISPAFLSRLVEATRITRRIPDATVVISVAGSADEQAKGRFLDEICSILEWDRAKAQLLVTAESTADEARFVQTHHGDSQIVVVTSAAHMPRAVQTFENAGLRVVPAPTAFYCARPGTSTDQSWRDWLPSADGLGANHAWLYEAVASAWQRMKG